MSAGELFVACSEETIVSYRVSKHELTMASNDYVIRLHRRSRLQRFYAAILPILGIDLDWIDWRKIKFSKVGEPQISIFIDKWKP